jgi:uncharacterized membrane protein
MADGVRPESRLSPVLTIVALVYLVSNMPSRFALVPGAFLYLGGLALALSMIGAGFSPPGSVWHRIERWLTFILVSAGIVVGLLVLRVLILDIIVHNRDLAPITLLTTSVALWMVNVLYFALLYWQLDRGGPDGRDAKGGRFDFTFAQDQQSGQGVVWHPTFPDYLFLGFTASTAFSPTDVLPLTTRAKMLMMVQSSISLVTVVIVAARAINVMK